MFDFLARAGRVIAILSIATLPSSVLSQSSGPRSPGSTSGWSNSMSLVANDGNYATQGIAFLGAGTITATEFGFSIPATHLIDGVIVEINRSQSGLLAADESVILLGNENGSVSEHAKSELWPSVDDDYEVYGNDTDTWGRTWTPLEINSASFGVSVTAGAVGIGTLRIDHIRITVYHHMAVVPIILSSFDAIVTQAHTVNLNWTTASEINNDYFTIEKSLDGESYMASADIKGSGNTTTPRHYSYEDRQPVTGRSYYRLKQTDFDGTFTYSKAVMVDYEGPKNPVLTILSNPQRDNSIHFRIVGVPDILSIRVVLFDLQGRILARQKYDISNPGVLEGKLKLAAPLSAGLYILKGGPGLQMTRKLVVR